MFAYQADADVAARVALAAPPPLGQKYVVIDMDATWGGTGVRSPSSEIIVSIMTNDGRMYPKANAYFEHNDGFYAKLASGKHSSFGFAFLVPVGQANGPLTLGIKTYDERSFIRVS